MSESTLVKLANAIEHISKLETELESEKAKLSELRDKLTDKERELLGITSNKPAAATNGKAKRIRLSDDQTKTVALTAKETLKQHKEGMAFKELAKVVAESLDFSISEANLRKVLKDEKTLVQKGERAAAKWHSK